MSRSDGTEQSSSSTAVDRARREIAAYVFAHPHATDTFPGVRDFWVPGLCEAVGVDAMRSALDRLIAEGTLEGRVLPGGDVMYTRGKRMGAA